MPTKKKRVGFIPREDVMKIINKLSIENNLSNSKIISILVEEALSTRGIFDKKNGRVTQLYQSINDEFDSISENSFNLIDNAKFAIDTKLGNQNNPSKSSHLKDTNQENFDIQTYKKFLLFLEFQDMMDRYKT